MEAFAYRLGNRSALEWVIDQYQVTTDKRGGITATANQPIVWAQAIFEVNPRSCYVNNASPKNAIRAPREKHTKAGR